METRTVVIPACVEHAGIAALRVSLPWTCLHCGGPRGEPFETLSYDGSRRLGCHGWTNPCGHVEKYSDVRDALAQSIKGGIGVADAQPVAWRCEVRGDGTDPKLGAVDWRHYHTTTSKREAQAFVARCGNGIEGRAVPLYPRAAAPQADAMLKAREAA